MKLNNGYWRKDYTTFSTFTVIFNRNKFVSFSKNKYWNIVCYINLSSCSTMMHLQSRKTVIAATTILRTTIMVRCKRSEDFFSFTYTRRSVQGSSMIITISRGSTWVDKQKIDASQERTGGHLHCVMLLCKQLNFDCYLGDMTIKLVFSHHLG